MRDGNQDEELDQSDNPTPTEASVEGEYPVDRLRQRISQSIGNRPIMVYLVLFAGAATLLLLLAIVWISATGGGSDERPICTSITTGEAEQAILGGQVERMNVLVDRDEPLNSLTGIVLEMTDGTCRQPAQGADVRNDLYLLLGVVEHYNNFGDQRVRVHYQRQEIQPELLSTSTPTLEPTLPPTETPAVIATDTPVVTETVPAVPTETATSTPTIRAPVTQTSTATVQASPAVPATPQATMTSTVLATPTP
jgi:hypothetical protein